MDHIAVIYCIDVALIVSLLLMWWDRGMIIKRIDSIKKEFNCFRQASAQCSRRADELVDEICEEIGEVKSSFKKDDDEPEK